MIGQAKPKKHTRASAPKVRTGCITCKKRHVKCDEAKPICNKCIVFQVKCDGYVAAPAKQPPPAPRTTRTSRPQQRIDNNAQQPAPLTLHVYHLSPDALLHDDPWTAFFFHHFRTSTVKGLALFPRSARFWDRHVLPLGNAVPAVRHAATALGVAHRDVLGPTGLPAPAGVAGPLDTLATRQYNKAIRQLLSHVSSGRPVDVRVVVTCSLLFYCLESIRGNGPESTQHLRSGSRLILHHASYPAAGNSMGMDDEAMAEFSDLFARLTLETSLYTEYETVLGLRSHMAPVSDVRRDPSRPLPSVAAARDALSEIDMDNGIYVGKVFEQSKRREVISTQAYSRLQRLPGGFGSDATAAGDLHYGPEFEHEISSVHRRFRHWRRRFTKTVAEAEKRGPPPKHERQEIMALTLRQLAWETGLDEVRPGDPEAADRVLDQAELMVMSLSAGGQGAPRGPVFFTLGSSIMSLTSYICFYSGQERHRRRALGLLRSARVREGLWDSVEMANDIEAQFRGRGARGRGSGAASTR